jgi:copper(I)-binding protein
LLALIATACGSGPSAPSSGTTTGGTLEVSGAWVRAAAAGGDSAVYLTIVNGTAASDTLLSATSDVAEQSAMHQTTTDSSGMTGMHMLSSLAIPAGSTVQFAPGGYHVMLTSLKQPLDPGATITVTLTFQHAGAIAVKAEVRAN